MKTYITRINGWSLRDKSHYMQHMVAETAHQLGCREMGIYRYYSKDESNESLNIRIDGIIAGINLGDIVICQFPTGNGTKFERTLISHIKAYGGRVAIFVHELESLAHEVRQFTLWETVELYNQAEVLIVPTYAMRKYLLEHGIKKGMKFVVQELWDYTAKDHFFRKPVFRKEIHVDDDSLAGIKEWNYPIQLNLYTNTAVEGENVNNVGEMEPDQLFSVFSGGYGLVWYRDEYSRRYMQYSASFSLARYLAAGIPVIVPIGISSCSWIEENHLGLAVYSLEEAVAAVERLTEEEYDEYVKSVEEFAPALRKGYYTQKCLLEAVQAFYRKDAGRIPAPEEPYYLGDCTFTLTVLNESYAGNLALSWDFKGKADGFLICGGSEKSIFYNIKNEYQHYSVLKSCDTEHGIVVMAYIETLRGKLIIAESEWTYLSEKQYGIPKVSLIIPAYNAENFISRCIDTVLAQSLTELEIIVVDDGSTDHTKEIIDWYAEKYANIAALHHENVGAAVARNIGIQYAKGEYIGFVDSDDMLRPDMVRRLYNSVKKNDCDIALTSVYRITNSGYDKFLQYPMPEDIAVETDAFFEMHFTKGVMFAAVIWNKLYRASLVKAHLLPSLFFEDGAWTPYLLSYTDRICYLNDCSYEWDRIIRDFTLTDKLLNKSKEELFEMYKDTVMFYLKNGNPQRINFLKMLAQKHLLELGRAYACDEYEKLWNQIEGMF